MKRLVLVVIFLLSLALTAHASVIKLPVTGQTKCYDTAGAEIACADTGQDGDIQAGIAWPSPRFTDNSDGTVTDNLTGLMWLKDANCANTIGHDPDGTGDGSIHWQNALDFIAGINNGTHAACQAGHTDWRLPNIVEMQSLIDNSKLNPSLPEGYSSFFNNVPIDVMGENTFYWTSTTNNSDVGARTSAIVLRVLNGLFNVADKDTTYRFAWPVRDSSVTPAIALPKTGQTNCYNASGDAVDCSTVGAGQDGAIQAGIAWPDPRFTNNGDGTITDELTGLMWLKSVNCFLNASPTTWQSALDLVADLNANPSNYTGDPCYYSKTYNDWRLPNILELTSLMHFEYWGEDCGGSPCTSLTEWLDSLGFIAATNAPWASTYGFGKDNARTANMFVPLTTIFLPKSNNSLTWAVRGGLGDPDISSSSTNVAFGELTVGSSSNQTITLTNDGLNYLSLWTITSPSSPFSLSTDNCSGKNIAPTETCTLTITFSPTEAGTFNITLNIPSDDPDENPLTLNISGSAVADTSDTGDTGDTDNTGSTTGTDGGDNTGTTAAAATGGCSLTQGAFQPSYTTLMMMVLAMSIALLLRRKI